MEYMDLNAGRVQVSAMGIADFLDGCFTKFKEGYQLDITQNDTYPVAYGGYFAVVLVPPESTQESEVVQTEEKEDQEVISEENPAGAEEKVAQATKSEDISQERGKPGRKGKSV